MTRDGTTPCQNPAAPPSFHTSRAVARNPFIDSPSSSSSSSVSLPSAAQDELSNDLPLFFFPALPCRPPAASIFFRRACIRVVMVHIGIVHMTLTHPAADAIARLDNGPGLVRRLAMYLFRIAE